MTAQPDSDEEPSGLPKPSGLNIVKDKKVFSSSEPAKVDVIWDKKPERDLEVATREAEELKAKGGEAYKKGDFLGAIEHYEAALDMLPDPKEGEEVHPLEPLLNSNICVCYSKEKDWEASIASATNAINGNPKLVKPHYHLIRGRMKQARSDEAKEYYHAAIKLFPDAPELAELKKELFPTEKQKEKNAYKQRRPSYASSSSSSDAGSDYMANVRKSEQEKKKKAGKVTSPGNLVSAGATEGEFTRLFGSCKSAYQAGQLEEAIKYGEKCFEQVTVSTNGERVKEVFNYVARAHMRKRDMQKACGVFEKLLTWQRNKNVGPKELSTSLNNLGMVYKNAGQFEKSEESYRLAIEQANHGYGEGNVFLATMWNNLGQVYRAQKKHSESVSCYRRAQGIRENAVGKDHASLTIDYIGLARATRDSGRLHEALLLFDRVLNMWRGRPDSDIVAEMPEMPDKNTFSRFKNEITTEYAILLQATKDLVAKTKAAEGNEGGDGDGEKFTEAVESSEEKIQEVTDEGKAE